MLETMHKQRQEEASQLNGDLSLFRDCLTSDVASCRQQFQRYRTELRNRTRSFLGKTRDRRQTQAQTVAEQLTAFVADLQAQTAEFLAVTQTERELMVHQLMYDLAAFRAVLAQASAALHHTIQADIQTLHTETFLLLEAAHQRRVEMQLQTNQDLATFVEQIRSDVQCSLANLSMERQARAAAIATFLYQSEGDRQEQFQRLSDRLAAFRSHLKQYVWDESPASRFQSDSPKTELPSQGFAKPAHQTPGFPVQASKPLLPTSPNAEKQLAQPGQPKVSTAPLNATAIAPSEEKIHEERIFQYIDLMQGARLTEIESSLNMSRFQAVEALRSLIQKGMITQRDRVYHIRDEIGC